MLKEIKADGEILQHQREQIKAEVEQLRQQQKRSWKAGRGYSFFEKKKNRSSQDLKVLST